MHFFYRIFIIAACLAALLPAVFCQDKQETAADPEIRLANGAPIEGVFKSAAPEGLTVQTSSGFRVLPWRYLSAGTRWRYERPMLVELEKQRIKAEKEAKAKAEAAAKAAAKAAAAKSAAATNNAAKTAAPVPTAANKPAAPAAK